MATVYEHTSRLRDAWAQFCRDVKGLFRPVQATRVKPSKPWPAPPPLETVAACVRDGRALGEAMISSNERREEQRMKGRVQCGGVARFVHEAIMQHDDGHGPLIVKCEHDHQHGGKVQVVRIVVFGGDEFILPVIQANPPGRVPYTLVRWLTTVLEDLRGGIWR